MRAKFRYWLIDLPVTAKRAIIIACDVALTAVVLAATLEILGRDLFSGAAGTGMLFALACSLIVPALALQRLYQAIIRFIGAEMMAGMLRGTALVAFTLAAAVYVTEDEPVRGAVAIAVVFWILASLVLGGARLFMRFLVVGNNRHSEPVAIYGAGEAGRRLIAAAASSHDLRPVLFVDDDPTLQKRVVAGIPVTAPADLPNLIGKHGIRRILLALPSVGRHRRQQILARLESLPVHVQTVPDIADLVTGKARLDELREVDVADILGREPVAPNPMLLDACVRGKSVMVTGAGGSIGSELCRQIIELGAIRLVLFELSELALYRIEQELRAQLQETHAHVELIALLGSVHHRDRLRQVMKTFGVQTVYHAAAYKHVPIVEFNMVEGVDNNVIGTWYAAEAADTAGVETFVLISTDKAVWPVNVMGATKRFAELVLQGITERGSRTRFCMVRFGNVLESSGSVVPLFREQIQRGGPVTVTHREVIRYFMTIPEAAQLVIQAGSMGKGGDVFVLDMGEPVRIADLAQRMIQLMGLTVRSAASPHGDIEIEYTGLRPGEKLYEELLIGNNVSGTEHPRILCAYEEKLPWVVLEHNLHKLLKAANTYDCGEAQRILRETVNGYQPVSEQIRDLIWERRVDIRPTKRPAEVIPIAGLENTPVPAPRLN
ncbi:MAG: polysaccharide biosynthesis protein [Gammaproteobacteria bacterium]|nr:polysaccharide biosynthesis protein [Gammaproteobacteria bacterium]